MNFVPNRAEFRKKGDTMNYVIALDAGTTSIRAFLYDTGKGVFVHGAQQEVASKYPFPGWVEQDANEIYFKAAYVLNDCLAFAKGKVAGIGITNQRETVVLWNRETGEPVCPAIVWQCRRTSDFCKTMPKDVVALVRARTGLTNDAYFSASKIRWAIEHVPAARALLREGKLCAGTIDSYLMFKLTEGKTFATDATNASRTMLYDIHTLDYDDDLLKFFGIPREILPEVRASDADFGMANVGGSKIPLAGVAGDQQSALIGQAALSEGEGKITYGTGLFLLFHTGERCISSGSGLLSTIAYQIGGKTYYALEGSVFHAGSSVQWLRDGLEILSSSAESERLALSVTDAGGVSFVPAFTGLGAPHWDSEARGMICGITRGTTRAHIVRAVLESIACGARELLDCMTKDSGILLKEIKCDGGASENNFLMQFQADVLAANVNRPKERESTALGAAYLCASAKGLMSFDEVARRRECERVFVPGDRKAAMKIYNDYLIAEKRALMHF